MPFTIKANRISKKFNNHTVFKNLEFSVSTAGSFAVTGDNGAGKSTLLEIVAGLRKPTSGKLVFLKENCEVNTSDIKNVTGFSSPKINPYEELTAIENIVFVDKMESNNTEDRARYFLDKFNLYSDRNKRVKYFSSGMKQRLRIIFAIMNDPEIIILDEPGSNLDDSGRDAVFSYLESVKDKKIIIIATNDKKEADFCNDRIFLKKQLVQQYS